MEWLDIVDENGVPTGQVVSRQEAHRLGLRHRTSHVWIVRRREGNLQVLLQKRSEGKDSYPGCYDISSAGHIPAGADFVPSALRELKEELGVTARPEELLYCGQRRFRFQEVFHGSPFRDDQVSNIYVMWLDWDEDRFLPQKEEISEVRWFDFADCLRRVEEGSIPTCIFPEELQMVLRRVEEDNRE